MEETPSKRPRVDELQRCISKQTTQLQQQEKQLQEKEEELQRWMPLAEDQAAHIARLEARLSTVTKECAEQKELINAQRSLLDEQ